MTAPTNTSTESLHAPVIDWFAENARDLPWRHPDAGPWGVMVSEFMLQQTPVSRVLPVYEQWLARWPRPADLAKEASGEAVRAWGRLGYPRRALRLHGAAVAITERHGGNVPTAHSQLLALPGIGEYTAAAVASFAYGQRHAVLDTNVRRVFARAVSGVQYPPNATTAAERKLARTLLPEQESTASRWAAASMELGALICTAKNESCHRCPIAAQCAWRLMRQARPRRSATPRADVRGHGPTGAREAAGRAAGGRLASSPGGVGPCVGRAGAAGARPRRARGGRARGAASRRLLSAAGQLTGVRVYPRLTSVTQPTASRAPAAG